MTDATTAIDRTFPFPENRNRQPVSHMSSGRLVPSEKHYSLSSFSTPAMSTQPQLSADTDMAVYSSIFTKWRDYNVNTSTSSSIYRPSTIATPPSTLPSSSPRSSMTSTLDEPENNSSPSTAASAGSSRRRSNSLSVPPPTNSCPNCGLRRPSNSSDQAALPSMSANISLPTRPHLPLHLHCPDSCPDEVHPMRAPISPVSPSHKSYHRRRRSSLCHAETHVDNAESMNSGKITFDVKADWGRQAETIARKQISRDASNASDTFFEEAIAEE